MCVLLVYSISRILLILLFHRITRMRAEAIGGDALEPIDRDLTRVEVDPKVGRELQHYLYIRSEM